MAIVLSVWQTDPGTVSPSVTHSITSDRDEQLLPGEQELWPRPASDLPARGAGHLPRAVRHRLSAWHSGQHLHRGHSCQVSPAHPR